MGTAFFNILMKDIQNLRLGMPYMASPSGSPGFEPNIFFQD